MLAADPAGPLTGERYPDSLIRPDRRAFQPRVGISWRPLLASSVVIRAGYGVYYDSSIYLPIATRMAQQSPLSKSLSVENSAANPLTLANGFNVAPGTAANTFAVDPNFRPGYAQNWQLSIQRDLPGSLVVIATYLGIKGTRAQQQFLPNTYPAGAADPCPACPAGYIYLTSNGNSVTPVRTDPVAAPAAQRFRRGIELHLLESDRQRRGRRLGPGRHGHRAGLAQSPRRARPLQLRPAPPADACKCNTPRGMGLGGGTLLGGWQGGLFKDWTLATQITAGSGLPLTPVYHDRRARHGRDRQHPARLHGRAAL